MENDLCKMLALEARIIIHYHVMKKNPNNNFEILI